MGLLTLVLLAACSPAPGEPTESIPDAHDSPAACVELDPGEVVFAPVELMVDPARSALVTVTSACEGDLEIQGLQLQNPDYPFSVGFPDALLLPQGQSTQITLGFDPPTMATWVTRLRVETNDPVTSTPEVRLQGEGLAPIVDVDPQSYDFGAPPVGCPREQPYTIFNLGTSDLEVQGFEFATGSADFSFDTGTRGALPWIVPPDERVDVSIHYRGLDDFADTAFLTVETSDPFTPELLVTAQGTASSAGQEVEVFQQDTGAIDLVFTVDRSSSMSGRSTSILSHAATVLGAFITDGTDYRAAVVVEDDGCVLGHDPWIDDSFTLANAATAFETMADFDLDLGDATESTTMGFALAEAALSPTNLGTGGCNEGLLRGSANLALVHISDSDDASSDTVATYVALFQAMKTNPADLTMSAVAGDTPDGCGEAAAGERYEDAATLTGGVFASICDTAWSADIATLDDTVYEPVDTFTLAGIPTPETLVVSVDGLRVSSGWSWDDALNAVVFDGAHLPSRGALIDVAYQPQGACDP